MHHPLPDLAACPARLPAPGDDALSRVVNAAINFRPLFNLVRPAALSPAAPWRSGSLMHLPACPPARPSRHVSYCCILCHLMPCHRLWPAMLQMKLGARQTMKDTAEKRGVPWTQTVEELKQSGAGGVGWGGNEGEATAAT